MAIQNVFKTLKGAAATREDKLLLLYAVIVFFGGALRKWFIASSAVANGVLLIQMLLPFLLFLWRSPGTVSPFAKFPILRIYFFYLVLHIILPTQQTIYHGMLGVLVYGPFWLGLFYYLANRKQFFSPKLIPYFLIFTAIEVFLGFVQYTLPTSHFLNKYASESMTNIAIVGDAVRITGTFSYISGYGAFMIFYPLFVWALMRQNFSLWFISIVMSFGMVAAFMTGSRATTMVYVGYMAVIIISQYSIRDIGSIFGRMLLPLIIGVSIIIGMGENPLKVKIEKAYANWVDRFERGIESGEQARRITWDFTYFKDLDRFPNLITGIGLGSTYQGAVILFGSSQYVKKFGYVEGELPKIVLEGGFIYLLLKVILATIATLQFSFRQPMLRFLIWFSMAYAFPIVFNVHNAAFLLMGIILVDNIVWRQQQQAQQPEATKNPEPVLKAVPTWGYPQVGEELR